MTDNLELLNKLISNAENLTHKNEIIDHVNEIKLLIKLNNLKPFNYYQKFNPKLTQNDYEGVKLHIRDINDADIKIDDYLNINCLNCLNCKLCYNCLNCKDCIKCNNCLNCKNCNGIICSSSCNDCIDCNNCMSCVSCNKCLCCYNCYELNNGTEISNNSDDGLELRNRNNDDINLDCEPCDLDDF